MASTAETYRNADFIPTLAGALVKYSKSPGKGTNWVDSVLVSLERERPPQYERLSRTCALATTLAALVGLSDHEEAAVEAAVTVGPFLHEVVADVGTGPGKEKRRSFTLRRKPRDWIEYLQNAGWLAPALEVNPNIH